MKKIQYQITKLEVELIKEKKKNILITKNI